MQPASHRPPEDLKHERGLARATRAGDGGEHPEGKLYVEVLERAVPDAAKLKPLFRLATAVFMLVGQHRIAGPPLGQKGPGDTGLGGGQLFGSSLGDNRAPLAAAAGAEVEAAVGGIDHIAVVLDHHDRVSEVAEFGQRRNQPVRIAGMQADRRLVEHVQHAGQATAHLGGQPNPLHFATGEAPGWPGHIEILETNLVEEGRPGGQLSQEVTGDRLFTGRQRDGGKFCRELAQRHPTPDVERAAPEGDGAGDGGQSAAAALAAGHLTHHGVDLTAKGGDHAGGIFAGGFEAFELEGEPGTLTRPAADLSLWERAGVRVLDRNPLFARTLKQHPLLEAREFVQW